MSNSVQLHGQQPTRLPYPQDSPGKNTGVGSHFLLHIIGHAVFAQSCLTLCDPMDCSLPSSSLHGILQARILEWAAISFSRGSSQPRDWTWVSRIAGRCFILWATRESQCTCFNAILSNHPTLTFSHRVQKSVLYDLFLIEENCFTYCVGLCHTTT